MKPLEPHPFANFLPLMSDAEYQALKADVIANNKFYEPARVFEGKLLDGRNRQRVAIETGITLPVEQFKGSSADALRYVYSKAVHRNMDDSQKACAAVHFLPYFEAEAKGRMGGTVAPVPQLVSTPKLHNGKTRSEMHSELTRLGQKKLEAKFRDVTGWISKTVDLTYVQRVDRILEKWYGPEQPAATGKSRDFAGSLFGVSGRYVQDAKLIFESDRKLFNEVFNGVLPISRAKRQIHRNGKEKSHAARLKEVRAAPGDVSQWFRIEAADCLSRMAQNARQWCKLVVADPPYNIGIDYGGKGGAKADALPRVKYLDWCCAWMKECAEQLTPDGSMWIIINDENAAELALAGKGLKLTLRRWVKWYETFGVNCSNNFNRTSRHLLYFVRDPRAFVFNAAAVMRKSDRQEIHGDKRADPAGKIWDDVWKIPRLVENSAERVPGFPTQLPLALIKPIVACCSDPGDHVLDPFTGSGTTGEAAILLHRRFLGYEKNPAFAQAAERRLRIALAERK